jgi:hypothetical protein
VLMSPNEGEVLQQKHAGKKSIAKRHPGLHYADCDRIRPPRHKESQDDFFGAA